MLTPINTNSKVFGQIDPGKTHEGKTNERGAFIIFRAQRNSFVATKILTA